MQSKIIFFCLDNILAVYIHICLCLKTYKKIIVATTGVLNLWSYTEEISFEPCDHASHQRVWPYSGCRSVCISTMIMYAKIKVTAEEEWWVTDQRNASTLVVKSYHNNLFGLRKFEISYESPHSISRAFPYVHILDFIQDNSFVMDLRCVNVINIACAVVCFTVRATSGLSMPENDE